MHHVCRPLLSMCGGVRQYTQCMGYGDRITAKAGFCSVDGGNYESSNEPYTPTVRRVCVLLPRHKACGSKLVPGAAGVTVWQTDTYSACSAECDPWVNGAKSSDHLAVGSDCKGCLPSPPPTDYTTVPRELCCIKNLTSGGGGGWGGDDGGVVENPHCNGTDPCCPATGDWSPATCNGSLTSNVPDAYTTVALGSCGGCAGIVSHPVCDLT